MANIQKNKIKMIAGIKNNCNFTEPKNYTYLVNGGFFMPKNQAIKSLYTTTFTSTLVSLARKGGDSLLYFNDINFCVIMPKKPKITPKLNKSKLQSTSIARHARPYSTLSRATKTTYLNPHAKQKPNLFLYVMLQAFEEWLSNESQLLNPYYTDKVLSNKISAARELFREEKISLSNYLKS